jgi:hypothetical protein
MKFGDILREDANVQLLHYVRDNEDFYEVGGNFVFLWTNKTLRGLIKNGAKPGTELGSISTPSKNQIGIGILNINTSDVCVGAIDHDYTALWVSSAADVRLFFRQIKNKKVSGLPTRLQNLAELLSTEDEEDEEESVTGSSVKKILDKIDRDDQYEGIKNEAYLIPGTLDLDGMKGDEVRAHFEEVLIKIKSREKILEKQVQQIMNIMKEKSGQLSKDEIRSLIKKKNEIGGNELAGLLNLHDDLKHFLKRERDLFIDDEEDDIEDDNLPIEAETDNTELKIDVWTDEFLADFPTLPLEDARQFDPNQ